MMPNASSTHRTNTSILHSIFLATCLRLRHWISCVVGGFRLSLERPTSLLNPLFLHPIFRHSRITCKPLLYASLPPFESKLNRSLSLSHPPYHWNQDVPDNAPRSPFQKLEDIQPPKIKHISLRPPKKNIVPWPTTKQRKPTPLLRSPPPLPPLKTKSRC